MKIRLDVGYAATDGNGPESVSLELETAPDEAPGAAAVLCHEVLDVLMTVRRIDYAADSPTALERIVESGAMSPVGPVNDADHCRRLACRHGKGHHRDLDSRGVAIDGEQNGSCLVCDDGQKCNTYVAPAA